MTTPAPHFFACGLGVGSKDADGRWLEALYPQPLREPDAQVAAALDELLPPGDGEQPRLGEGREVMQAIAERLGDSETGRLARRLCQSQRPILAAALPGDGAPVAAPDIYLKLQLISHRLCRPNELNLDGIFEKLPTVAWTSQGPMAVEELDERRLQARLDGEALRVHAVDKFPSMSDYCVPSGVRIAHSARVRLGAWLGEGTTVMHEGFINFNAGADGPNMIEGRVSAGVTVGAGSDFGGGSSAMGTLSGGNQRLISIGRRCLIGANAGTGIPLGDDCTIEAGLYLTAGAPIRVLDADGNETERCKARDLAGRPGLLFRRNGADGAIECLPNDKAIALNASLHDHN